MGSDDGQAGDDSGEDSGDEEEPASKRAKVRLEAVSRKLVPYSEAEPRLSSVAHCRLVQRLGHPRSKKPKEHKKQKPDPDDDAEEVTQPACMSKPFSTPA